MGGGFIWRGVESARGVMAGIVEGVAKQLVVGRGPYGD